MIFSVASEIILEDFILRTTMVTRLQSYFFYMTLTNTIAATVGIDLILKVEKNGIKKPITLNETVILQFHKCLCTSDNDLCKIRSAGESIYVESQQTTSKIYSYINKYFCFLKENFDLECRRSKQDIQREECLSFPNQQCPYLALTAKGNTCALGSVDMMWITTSTAIVDVFSKDIELLFSCLGFCYQSKQAIPSVPVPFRDDAIAIASITVSSFVALLLLTAVILFLKQIRLKYAANDDHELNLERRATEGIKRNMEGEIQRNEVESSSGYYVSLHDYLVPISNSGGNSKVLKNTMAGQINDAHVQLDRQLSGRMQMEESRDKVNEERQEEREDMEETNAKEGDGSKEEDIKECGDEKKTGNREEVVVERIEGKGGNDGEEETEKKKIKRD
nr:hypothetical protein BgiMline_013969 [Biomphalaria glabrata]